MTKNINLNKSLLLLLPAFGLMLSGCETEEGKELVGFFFGFIIFLIGTIVTGIPAIVLSAVGITAKNNTVPILAIVFTAIYAVFFFVQASIFVDAPSEVSGSIMVFPLITAAIIVMCVVFIVMGFKRRSSGVISSADSQDQLLDDIIESEDEDSLV